MLRRLAVEVEHGSPGRIAKKKFCFVLDTIAERAAVWVIKIGLDYTCCKSCACLGAFHPELDLIEQFRCYYYD